MLGAGFMARTHSHAARAAGATLDSLASSSMGTAGSAALALGYGRALPADELLALGLPVVHICTPNAVHAEHAIAALRAGSFVICEKPLATSPGAARDVVDAAARAGVSGAVPFVYRYHPMVIEARHRVRAGHTGSVLALSGVYLQDWMLHAADVNWRVRSRSGGPSRAFADIGSHLVDLIEFVTDQRITRVAAVTRTVHPERGGSPVETEDAVALTVELTGGAIGSLLVSQVSPGRKNGLAIEIGGSRESLRFEQEDPERLWVGRREESAVLRRDPATLSAEASRVTTLPAGHPEGYQSAFNSFIADAYAVAAGQERELMPTFADGLRAAEVTDAVLRAAQQRTWVEVNPT